MQGDILDRLRVDPGQRTFGQLLQEREAAACEIQKLRADVERLRAMRIPGRSDRKDETDAQMISPVRPGMLIRLSDVCKLIGVSRSTIYKWVAQGTFPAPVRVSEHAVRWRIDEIQTWQEAR